MKNIAALSESVINPLEHLLCILFHLEAAESQHLNSFAAQPRIAHLVLALSFASSMNGAIDFYGELRFRAVKITV